MRLAPATLTEWSLVCGADLIALGHEPGPRFRGVMVAALTAQDEGMVTDRAGAVAWLDDLAADGRLVALLDPR